MQTSTGLTFLVSRRAETRHRLAIFPLSFH